MSRLRDIGDARIQIEELPEEAVPVEPAASGMRSREKLAWVLAGAMALVAAAAILWPSPPEPPSTLVRLELTPDTRLETTLGPALALSPDGSRLVYVAGSTPETAQLYVRSISELESTLLSGTEGAHQPFFSPDGEWVAFFADSRLKKVSIHGGASIPLCEASNPQGGSWGPDETIVFNRVAIQGLWRVSASGGEPVALTTLSESEYSHRWPHHLPDGRTLLFTAVSAGLDANDASLEVLSLVSGERTVVYRGGFYARYLETGHLAYVRDGTLFVAPFDAERLEMAGPPAPVVVGVLSDAGEETWGAVQISFSRTGTLVYLPGAMRGASDYLSSGWTETARFRPSGTRRGASAHRGFRPTERDLPWRLAIGVTPMFGSTSSSGMP